MDKGFLLAVWTVLSGWALTLAAMLVIKGFIMTIGSERSLIGALVKVTSALSILLISLLTWYWINRRLFIRLKRGGGPGGT